jgi:hypothetical protein
MHFSTMFSFALYVGVKMIKREEICASGLLASTTPLLFASLSRVCSVESLLKFVTPL